MKNLISYHPAGLEDLPFIVDVYNSTIAGRMVTADTTPVSVESRIDWFNQHQTTARPLWLIEYDGKDCGWVSLSSFYGRPAYNKTVEISLYIHRDFRGKQIAQTIVPQLESHAKLHQIETILCFIFGHNLPSLSLFSKLGYQQYGLLPEVAELDNIKRDLIILGKKIV